LFQEDEEDLSILEFYKRLPYNKMKECEIFITPEKIYGIQYADDADTRILAESLNILKTLKSNELKDKIELHRTEGVWREFYTFKNVVKAIREYLQLRPNLIEEYPECMI